MAESRDAKLNILRKQGSANPRPEDVTDPLFRENIFFDPRDIVQVKYEMLRRVQIENASVTAAAAAFGFSRVAFYQIQKRLGKEGLPGLIPKQRGPKQGHKLSDAALALIEQALAENDSLHTSDLIELVQKRFGVAVHPTSIGRGLAKLKKKRRR